MSFFGDLTGGLFGGGGSPADAASGYLSQIPDELKKYLQPYIDRGNQAYGFLNPIFSKMATDPTGYLSGIESQYSKSPDFMRRRDEAEQASRNASAAGGMLGTPNQIQQASQIADSLQGQDMQQWLGNVMGLQNKGLAGESGFEQEGYGASNNLAQALASVLSQRANLAFQDQAGKNRSASDIFGALAGMLGAGFDKNGSTSDIFNSLAGL